MDIDRLMTEAEEPVYLYHEKQVAALCGQHCLNTLLQGPYFTEIDLAQIAQELDALEQSFMAESGMDTQSYKLWQEEASGNVAADGMFSIQVLSKALSNWELTCTNLHSPEAVKSREHPENEEAFICNLQEHWLTVRRVNGTWYNFNSLFSAPEFLGTLYLTTFLATLRGEGYSIFVVQGRLPNPHPEAGSQDSVGRWFTPDEAKAATKEAVNAREMGYLKAAKTSILDKVSEKGTLMTLRNPQQSTVGGKRERDASPGYSLASDDDDLAQAIAASLQHSQNGQAGPLSSTAFQEPGPQHGQGIDGDEDEDMAAAIAASLASTSAAAVTPSAADDSLEAGKPGLLDPGPEPDAGPGVVTLAVRLPNGKRLVRRFESSQSVSMILSFIQSQGTDVNNFELTTSFPAKALSDPDATLEAAGINDKETLVLRKRPA